MNKKLSIVIGRFQPLHNGHVDLISQAKRVADKTLVLVGSCNSPRTPKNPWTFEERRAMIRKTLGENKDFIIRPLEDYLYSDLDWCNAVQDHVHEFAKDEDVILVGCNKDESTYYMNLFPQWKVLETKPLQTFDEGKKIIDATTVRKIYFETESVDDLKHLVPGATVERLGDWTEYHDKADSRFLALQNEYNMIKSYKEAWSKAPFPPTFVTTDAVVMCGSNILLVKRKFAPGKGLWALPGGFVNQNEFIQDSMLRELKEETKIKVHKNILRGSIKNQKVFDAPGRSLRGRTITHAYLIVLNGYNGLPEVKGSDDAEDAKWVPLHKFYGMETQLFEDHWHIASNMIGLA